MVQAVEFSKIIFGLFSDDYACIQPPDMKKAVYLRSVRIVSERMYQVNHLDMLLHIGDKFIAEPAVAAKANHMPMAVYGPGHFFFERQFKGRCFCPPEIGRA